MRTTTVMGCACVGLLALACGSDGSDGTNGIGAATEVTNEAAGSNCANGGVAIKTGSDANGDGTVDDGGTTTYVCNGSNGKDGTAGTDGVNGTDGTSQASRVTAEPAGSNCTYGGLLLELGADDNANGLLDQDEAVMSSSYLCSDSELAHVHVGDLVLSSAEDVSAAQEVTAVFGRVLLAAAGSALGAVTLPKLTLITEGLYGSGDCDTTATTLSFPLLATVGGEVCLSGNTLASLSAPQLRSTGGAVLLYDASNLTELHFPALTDVGGEFYLSNTGTTVAELPALAAIGSSIVGDSLTIDRTKLPTLALPALTQTYGNVQLTGNAQLTSASMPSLASSTGSLNVRENTRLTTVTVPFLTQVNGLSVESNAALNALSLPALTSLGDGGFIDANLNPCLYYQVVAAFVGQSVATNAPLSTSDNCNDATLKCPLLPVGTNRTEFRFCFHGEPSAAVTSAPTSYANAVTRCAAFGSSWTLAVIATAAEFTALTATTNVLSTFGNYDDLWLGIDELTKLNEWKWLVDPGTGYEPPESSGFFAPGQPVEDVPGQCGEYRYEEQQVYGLGCTEARSYVCRHLIPE